MRCWEPARVSCSRGRQDPPCSTGVGQGRRQLRSSPCPMPHEQCPPPLSPASLALLVTPRQTSYPGQGKPRQMLHLPRQGQLRSSQPAPLLWCRRRETCRQVGQMGRSRLLILNGPAMAKSLCLQLSGGCAGSISGQDTLLPREPSTCGCCTRAPTSLSPETSVNSPNPLCHQRELTPPKPQRCPAVQAETGFPGEI